MIWCYSVLAVHGAAFSLDCFVKKACSTVCEKAQTPHLLHLTFGAFLPRPQELELHECAVGREGYEAFYGNFAPLLEGARVRAIGARTRETLCAYFDWINPEYRRLADRYAQNLQKFGHRTWLSWNLEHYGTKWDLTTDTKMRRMSGTEVRYWFRTLEAPPLPWVQAVSELYPQLTFTLKSSGAQPRVLLRAV